MFIPRDNEPVYVFDIVFPNRIGLGAGFDKNAMYLRELSALGFGFIEIGTVTPQPQDGNDKPRLFRLSKDSALINRMGFNNDGVEQVALRLKNWKAQRLQVPPSRSPKQTSNFKPQTSNLQTIIGGNIGKNKLTSNEDAWKDYEKCFNGLHDCVDYFVVNVSSPNTPGLRALQEKEALKKILTNLQVINKQYKLPKPILLKISPDLTYEQIDDVIELAIEIDLDGIVATNTTIDKSKITFFSKPGIDKIGPGGLSGEPLKARSTEIIKYIFKKSNGRIPIIASGGIFNGPDAKEKLNAGASLVQVWTGFIYEGPGIVKKISTYLAAHRK